jgi:photosystem II stability/assembly factor-like uncharacterized protein
LKLLLGTTKGLLVYEKLRRGWKCQHISFLGMPVSMIYAQSSQVAWFAGVPHKHWGQKLYRSDDAGKTWQPISTPKYPTDALLRNGKMATLKAIWCMKQVGETYYIGTEPGGLFFGSQQADFQLVKSLWQHPTRAQLWMGAGKDEPFIHSIVAHPQDNNHFYIAVSCGGVFETKDNGQSWKPKNNGLKATYLPNPNVNAGHDPHLMLLCEKYPNVLWQQNHCGVYRSVDGGAFWEDVSDIKNGIYYGFALAIDHQNPLRAWVIPAMSDEMRIAEGLALTVRKTEDGGQSWIIQKNGLPQKNCFDIVFRHAFDRLNTNLVFGTTTGNVFASQDDGDNWKLIAKYLPRIDTVQLLHS